MYFYEHFLIKPMEYTDNNSGKSSGKYQKKRKTETDLTVISGKIPPQAKDLEESILGAILLEKQAIDAISDILSPDAFYVEAHQTIFRAMLDLSGRSQPIDIHTVCEKLRSTDELERCGGPYYVTRLTNSVVSSANIEFHGRIVLSKYIQREVIRAGVELISRGYEDSTDVFELLEQADKAFLSINNSLITKKYDRVDTLSVRAIQEIEAIRHSPARISGVPSGYPDIDSLTHGWQNTDLIIVAARPSVGKTAFALNLARNAALSDIKPTPTAFFSMEMSSGQLIRRMFASEAEMPLEKIARGRMDDDDMKKLFDSAIRKIGPAPLFIDDTPSLNIYQLRAKCRRLRKKENVGLIIIDYLQLMSGTEKYGGRNREQEISEISRGLKGLAKELGIPIIALSQLSRAVESRGGEKMPQLSDLRESGAIEQDGDVVVFLYRPEYYSIARDAKGESNPGETHLKFAKHRNGKLDTIKLRALLWCQKFVPIDKDLTMNGQEYHINKKKKDDQKLSGPKVEGGPLPF
jgi:replicative DNA helicase